MTLNIVRPFLFFHFMLSISFRYRGLASVFNLFECLEVRSLTFIRPCFLLSLRAFAHVLPVTHHPSLNTVARLSFSSVPGRGTPQLSV
jgi:hypothetical protein